MSRKPTGPGRGGDAVEIVSAAIAFQSSTASARAMCDPNMAENAKRKTVAKRSGHVFELMRYMGSSLSGAVRLPRHFETVQDRQILADFNCLLRAYPSASLYRKWIPGQSPRLT